MAGQADARKPGNQKLFDRQGFLAAIRKSLGEQQILLKPSEQQPFANGIRVGGGPVLAVLKPHNLVTLWRVLTACVE